MTVEFSEMLADCVYRVFILRYDDKRGEVDSGQWPGIPGVPGSCCIIVSLLVVVLWYPW